MRYLILLLLFSFPAWANVNGQGNTILLGVATLGDCISSGGSIFLQDSGAPCASSTSGIILGTSASTTNPQKSGDATTGLYSASTGTVSISASGTNEFNVGTGGVAIGTTTFAGGYALTVSGGLNMNSGYLVGMSNIAVGGVSPNNPLTVTGNEDVSGSVGIGSTSPRNSLDLSQKTDAVILPSGTTVQRPATGINGMLRYNSTATPTIEAYVNNVWTSLGSGGGGTITLGASTSATNPQKSGDATTGLYSSATSTVSVATGGVQAIYVDSSHQVGIGTSTNLSPLTVFGNINLPPTAPGAIPWNINFGYAYGATALYLFDDGTPTGKWGWGLNAGEMQFFSTTGGTNHFSWNDGGNFQSSGTNELMRLSQENVVGAPTLFLYGNQSSNANATIDLGPNYGQPAILLYHSGSNQWGWGLNPNEMQFFQASGLNAHYSWNCGSGGLQTSGTCELMRLNEGTSGGLPQLGIGSTSPRSSLDISQQNDAIILPIGTTGQRPGTQVNGMMRYNSSSSLLEGYIGNAWGQALTGSEGTPTCGTGCSSITSGSTDARGSMTVTALATSAAVNFSATLPYTPFCTCSGSLSTSVSACSATTSALTTTLSVGVTGDVVTWHCPQ